MNFKDILGLKLVSCQNIYQQGSEKLHLLFENAANEKFSLTIATKEIGYDLLKSIEKLP